MSQYDFGDLESPLPGPVFVNTHLEPWRDALHSYHAGTSRPDYAVAHMIWWDNTTNPWILKAFTGSDDVTLGTLDTVTLEFTPANVPTDWSGSAGGTANALTLTPAQALDAYAAGVAVEFLVTATNTAAGPTLNISGLGALTIKTFLGAGKVNAPKGALQNGMIARVVLDGVDAVLLNPRPYNSATAMASASTLVLDNADGDYVEITGTTTVTAITLAEGVERTIRAAGAFQLTHSSSLVLPGAANITTAAGDVLIFRGEASGVTRLIGYLPNKGKKDMAAYFIAYPSNKDYRLVVNAPWPGSIEEVTTRCESGSCTATTKINTTALGGTANSVTTSEQSQAHTTSNTFAAGDDIVLTISSNASCVGMSYTMKMRLAG